MDRRDGGGMGRGGHGGAGDGVAAGGVGGFRRQARIRRGADYCKGADKLFDQAAAMSHKPALAFARVQWTPWRKMPDFGGLADVGWVPQQPVFFKSKLLGRVDGKPGDPAGLLVKIDEVIADAPTARVAKESSPPAAPVVALSDVERRAVKLGIRRDFLDAVGAACGGKFPERAATYKSELQAWRTANEEGLKQADLLMISRASRDDAKVMEPLIEEEEKALQTWQTGKLGISMQKAPTMADCDKLTGNLGSLPY